MTANGTLNGGGQGDGPLALSDDHHLRDGLNMMRRAVREQWGVCDEHRKRAPEILMEIAENEPDGIVRVKAIAVMRDMQRDNHGDVFTAAGLKGSQPSQPPQVNLQVNIGFDKGG